MNSDSDSGADDQRSDDDALFIEPVAALRDNYIWVVHDGVDAIVVDPGESAQVQAFLDDHGLQLQALLLTHHHADHIGGVDALLGEKPVPVYGPSDPRIPQVTQICREGDRISIERPQLTLSVLETPGHTSSHIMFHDADRLFCGDTLFSVGCGRLFEGDPEQMRRSLGKLEGLSDRVRVYCAHEYTVENCRFALTVDPGNQELREYAEAIAAIREDGTPSVPSTLGQERRCNPFLRVEDPSVIAAVQRRDRSCSDNPDAVFGTLRRWKDEF